MFALKKAAQETAKDSLAVRGLPCTWTTCFDPSLMVLTTGNQSSFLGLYVYVMSYVMFMCVLCLWNYVWSKNSILGDGKIVEWLGDFLLHGQPGFDPQFDSSLNLPGMILECRALSKIQAPLGVAQKYIRQQVARWCDCGVSPSPYIAPAFTQWDGSPVLLPWPLVITTSAVLRALSPPTLFSLACRVSALIIMPIPQQRKGRWFESWITSIRSHVLLKQNLDGQASVCLRRPGNEGS